MGRKRKTVDDTGDPPPPKERKRVKRCNYTTRCKKLQIPLPELSDRETDHLNSCFDCQMLWPLYLFREHYQNEEDIETVGETWQNMPETTRMEQLKKLQHEQESWARAEVKKRAPSAYQVFLGDRLGGASELKDLPFSERNKILAKVWAGYTAEQKRPYSEQHQELKAKIEEERSSVPPFLQRVLRAANRSHRAERVGGPKKPPNAYLMFLRERWEKERIQNVVMRYRDVMQICSTEWERMTEQEKLPYTTKYAERKIRYLAERARQQETS